MPLLSEILDASFFGDGYNVVTIDDEPLIIDQDIYLGARSMQIVAINLEIPEDRRIYSFEDEDLIAPDHIPSEPNKANRGDPHPNSGDRSHGGHGHTGYQGKKGNQGRDAGAVRIIVKNEIKTQGKLTIDLYGQGGGRGQNGGQGGDGNYGGNGIGGSDNLVKCKRQPGHGGNGGNGGKGGTAGIGGDGGDGGLCFYSATLAGLVVKGNMVGGKGGEPGTPGEGGNGGAGGHRGSRKGYCQRKSDNGTPGSKGATGDSSQRGVNGEEGKIEQI